MEFDIVFQILGVFALGLILFLVYDIVYPPPKPEPPLNAKEVSDEPKARFLFFYATWCPWSKKAQPQWDAFVEDLTRQPVKFGGLCVKLEGIDGDVDKETRKKYDVSAYPSFKLELPSGEVREMTTIPTKDGMRDFLIKALGPEEPVKLTTSTA